MSGPEPWRAAVVADLLLAAEVKVTLLDLWVLMRRDGTLSVSRDKIARRSNRSHRTVDYRLTAALKAGYLIRCSPGRRGSTAVYRAAIPGELARNDACALTGRVSAQHTRGLTPQVSAQAGCALRKESKWAGTQPQTQKRAESELRHPTPNPSPPGRAGTVARRPARPSTVSSSPTIFPSTPRANRQAKITPRAGFGGDLTR